MTRPLYFPLTIIDGIFGNPEEVLELAKSQTYESPAETNYPGVASEKQLFQIDVDLAKYVCQQVFSPFWDPRDHEIEWHVTQDFQKIVPHSDRGHLLNNGLIHADNNVGQLATAIIYLNDAPEGDVGTSFYEKKKDFKSSSITGSTVPPEYLNAIKDYHKTGQTNPRLEELVIEHRAKFNETIRVQQKFNRMVLFPAEIWHAQTTYGGEDRYSVRTFVHNANIKQMVKTAGGSEKSTGARWPMQRTN
tara:strand:- start:20 stop:760 length:741 start_codon:yes stop_codon:yes gene_type:complete